MGTHYYNDKYDYPLRKKDIKRSGLENKQSKFYNNEELLDSIIKDLKNPQISLEEIATLYDVSVSTLTLINRGMKYTKDNEEYPLRKKNANQKRVFSDEEMNFIKECLINSNKSMSDIAKLVNCGDRKTISAINKGIR